MIENRNFRSPFSDSPVSNFKTKILTRDLGVDTMLQTDTQLDGRTDEGQA
jgi:hypothetical protein